MNSRCNRKCFCFQNRYAFNIVSNGPTSTGFQNIEVKLNIVDKLNRHRNHFPIMSSKLTTFGFQDVRSIHFIFNEKVQSHLEKINQLKYQKRNM